MAGNTYTWEMPMGTFEEGEDYVYQISVPKTPVQIGSRIENWLTVHSGSGTAR